MIRDPPDGTVKEKPVMSTGTSGLPLTKQQGREVERLNASREWLKNYLKPKETP